jgi:hypothetical protein
MGLMTRNELMRLLMIQADRKQPLADVFVSEGILSEKQVAQEMAEFRQLQASRRVASGQPSKIVPAPRGYVAANHASELNLAN